MEAYQRARGEFIDGIAVFKETKNPHDLGVKTFEESGEFIVALAEYAAAAKILPPSMLTPYILHIQEEAADVMHLLFDTANLFHFDMGKVYEAKLAKDKQRFPASEMQRRYEGEPGREVYLRRKRALGERKN